MAQICIKDLRLRTIIGINDWEKLNKQDIVINVWINFDASTAALSDDIEDTVDYKTITKNIIRFVEDAEIGLIEKLASAILDIIFGDHKVEAAKVRVDKPNALRFADSVSVELDRKRNDT